MRKISHAMERVKRMAENGRRVFFLIDSLDALTGLLDVPGSELSPFSCSALGRALCGAGSVTTLTFDLEALEYISSAGLRVLLSTQKQMNRQGIMKLIHVDETIMEIFEVTGFTDILTIE